MIKPDTDAAVEFLGKWSPPGPWTLVAISPSKKNIRPHACTTLCEARTFIDENNGISNLYWVVNSTFRTEHKKPCAADISHLYTLHVDLDPRAGEDINEERKRILARLRAYNPAPTVIIDSSGGYQGFWKLAEPLPIEGHAGQARQGRQTNAPIDPVGDLERIGADHVER